METKIAYHYSCLHFCYDSVRNRSLSNVEKYFLFQNLKNLVFTKWKRQGLSKP